MKFLAGAAVVSLLLMAAAATWVVAAASGRLGELERAGEIVGAPRPRALTELRRQVQVADARARGVDEPRQILFGDLHAHTTFSGDAFIMSLPLAGGTGTHPPADACDFARYCSQLDFWSINDHAEGITQQLWEETVDSVRQCNAVAGDPRNPDLVTFLGWEWSQIGTSPETHYGHKNVVLRDFEEGAIPTRPIGARAQMGEPGRFVPERLGQVLALTNGKRGRDLATLVATLARTPACPDSVPVRELPLDCLETTLDPAGLFAKLRDWDFPAIVIPHGTTWGMYTPPGSSWERQIASSDPELETLVELYSGHGNTEEYRDWRAVEFDAQGAPLCPSPVPGYLPSCWRAGELIESQCRAEGISAAECGERAVEARALYARAGAAGWHTLPGHAAEAWLDAGQCTDCFLPAFNYRPASSVQYMLARRSFDADAPPRGLQLGFIGSSDIHTARPGTGYKEFGRGEMTEGRGRKGEGTAAAEFLRGGASEPASRAVAFDLETTELRAFQLFEGERGTGYFLTGGLVAVHSEGRDRQAIWDALERKEVYATSGPRTLLWFELLGDSPQPMGSGVTLAAPPHFRARAVGSFEQREGCPDWASEALGPHRIADLCLNECHHPSDQRRLVTRIEVVRIRPQRAPDEPLAELIEDPWRVHHCPPDPSGCEFRFDDPDYASAGRDTLYYVRAIEAPSLAVHADPLGCRVDSDGRCISVALCNLNTPHGEDCRAETEERAWSSPIYLHYAETPRGSG